MQRSWGAPPTRRSRPGSLHPSAPSSSAIIVAVVEEVKRSEGESAKAWFRGRIEELSEERAEEVLAIWEAPADAELPAHYADGESIPKWVFVLRDVLIEQRSQKG
jgi:hypothetical protein